MYIITYLRGPPHAVPQQPDAVPAVVLGGALVQRVEVDGVLERAVLDQAALRYLAVVAHEAHGEAEVGLGVRVQLLRAQLDDVAQALGRAVLAVDAVVVGRSVGRCETLCERNETRGGISRGFEGFLLRIDRGRYASRGRLPSNKG